MADIQGILLAAQSPDKQLRDNAEQAMEQAIQTRCDAFLHALSAYASTEGGDSSARQLALIRIKNFVSIKTSEAVKQALDRWGAIPADVRNGIKTNLLNTFSSTEMPVCKQAAYAVSAIAVLEIPTNQWPDVLGNLSFACGHMENVNFCLSALWALGSILEQLGPKSKIVFELQTNGISGEVALRVLTAITSCCHPSNANMFIRTEAMKALCQAVPFCNDILNPSGNVASGPGSPRSILMDVILNGAKDTNLLLKREALATLTSIAELYYKVLPSFIKDIADITIGPVIAAYLQYASQEIEPVVMQAIEFWDTVASYESSVVSLSESDQSDCCNIIESQCVPLVEALYCCLLADTEDSNLDDWTVPHAAAGCIEEIGYAVSGKYAGQVLEIVRRDISVPSEGEGWHKPSAAMVLLGTCIRATSRFDETLMEGSLLRIVLDKCGDSHESVRNAAIWLILCICDNCSKCITLEEARITATMKCLLDRIKDENDDVVCNAARCIASLAVSINGNITEARKTTSPFSPFFNMTAEALFSGAGKPGADSRVRRSLLSSLCEIVSVSCLDSLDFVNSLAEKTISTITSFRQMPAGITCAEFDELLCLLSSVVCSCAQALGPGASKWVPGYVSLLEEIHKSNCGVLSQEESIRNFSALTDVCPEVIAKELPNLWPMIFGHAKTLDEHDLCKESIGALGDIIRTIENIPPQFVDSAVTLMLEIASKLPDPELFFFAVSCLTDAVVYYKQGFAKFLEPSLTVCMCITRFKVDTTNEDELDAFLSSFEAVIEFFSTILSFCDPDNVSRFIGIVMVPCISIYVPYSILSESLDRKVVNLIADIGTYSRAVFSQLLGTGNSANSFTQLVLAIQSRSNEPETKASCDLALKVIKSCAPSSLSAF